MSFNLMLPPILGVVGLAIAFVIYTVMSRASDGEAKERGIADILDIPQALERDRRGHGVKIVLAEILQTFGIDVARHHGIDRGVVA